MIPYSELLGAGLFGLAGVTEEPLGIGQLLPLHELLSAITVDGESLDKDQKSG